MSEHPNIKAALSNTAALVVCVEQYEREGEINEISIAPAALKFIEFLRQKGVERLYACLSLRPERDEAVACLRGTLGGRLRTASPLEIEASLTDLQKDVADQALIVYWIGHGYSINQDDQRLVLPQTNDRTTMTMRLQDLRNHLTSPAYQQYRRQLFLIDACQGYISDERNRRAPYSLDEPELQADVEQDTFQSVQNGGFADFTNGGLFSRELIALLKQSSEHAELPNLIVYLKQGLQRRFEQLRTQLPGLLQAPIFVEYRTKAGDRANLFAYYGSLPSHAGQGWVSQQDLNILFGILHDTDLRQDLLQSTYQNSLPKGVNSRLNQSLPDILAHLAGFPVPKIGMAPLILFVEELARELPSHRQRLNEWFEMMADANPSLQQSASAETKRIWRYFVSVILGSDADPNGNRIASIRSWKEGETMPLSGGWDPDAPVSLAEVQANLIVHLDKLRQHLPRANAEVSHTEIMIEFCLPRILLPEPVDEWEISGGVWDDEPQLLGIEYPVVVRDVQRMSYTGASAVIEAAKNWQACWARLRKRPYIKVNKIKWLSQPLDPPKSVFEALKPPPAGEPQVVCIGFSFAVQEDCLIEEKRHCLRGPWHAGVPAVVWPRQPFTTNEEVRQWFGDLFKDCHVSDLPQRIWELRKAQECKLTLVWDDPDRTPHLDLDEVQRMRGRT